MMPSPPIDDHRNTPYSCWLTAGRDRTRIGPLNWPAVEPSIGSRNVRSAHFHRHEPAPFKLKRARRPPRSNLSMPRPAAKSP
jgi:hypothetical protein